MRWFMRLLCALGVHAWVKNGCRQGCRQCGRREVYDGSLWQEHIYPLDADPEKDPTPIMGRFEEPSTIGWEMTFRQLLKEAEQEESEKRRWGGHRFDPKERRCWTCGMSKVAYECDKRPCQRRPSCASTSE